MNDLQRDFDSGLFDSHGPPCLSLYQPTLRRHTENRQNSIRFRNLARALEESLRRTRSPEETAALVKPFQALANSSFFWETPRDGLAVLGAPSFFRVYELQRTVPELAVVADSFHVKPLLRILQSADRYQVLGITRRDIRLFEGNRDALDEIEPAADVPRTIVDALGAELTEPYRAVVASGATGAGAGIRAGRGTRKDEIDLDTQRFFRAVDRAILEHHSRPTGLPLLLAALPEHHDVFRQVSHNPYLMPEGVDVHPDSLEPDALRGRAWKVVESRYLARLAGLVESFQEAESKGRGSGDLEAIAAAAVAGRVATLLIEADRPVPGRIDASSGSIARGELEHPEVDDLLDDLGELVMKRGGRVVVVPAQRMPVRTGAAAIFRF